MPATIHMLCGFIASGKTTFCRLVRHVLGEGTFAPEATRRRIRERFPAGEPAAHPIRLDDPFERALGIKLLRFADVLECATEHYRPSMLADYLFDLAKAYSSFYQKYSIIHEPDRERKVFLLWMTDFFRRQLERTGSILGIQIPDYM